MKKLIVFLFVVIVFTQCEDVPKEVCSTPATVRDLTGLDGCGWIFELEDGTRLEPLIMVYVATVPPPKEAIEDPLYNFEFVEGKPVLINYEIVEPVSICNVGPVVKITCISEIVGWYGPTLRN